LNPFRSRKFSALARKTAPEVSVFIHSGLPAICGPPDEVSLQAKCPAPGRCERDCLQAARF
jgi:hypothetical protein